MALLVKLFRCQLAKQKPLEAFRTFLEHVAELPWNERSEEHLDIAEASRILDAHAIKQRAAHETLNNGLEAKLKGAGMQFNKVDGKPFREMLQKSGYYAEWKKKFGVDAWTLLEKYTGKLA
jgi:TRAP-type C4-dicarboxylate transport system substrate-binding protein